MQLADKVVPAPIALLEHTFGFEKTQLVRSAAVLRVADQIAGGAKTAEELARAIGRVDADALHRLLRALVSLGVFELDQDGRFRNNRLSAALKVGVPGSLHAWSIYCGSKSNFAAWADFEESVETGKNAFERIHGKDCWSYFAEHPAEEQVFAQSMADLTDLIAPAVADAYPFSEFKIVCDVAGGRGALLASILSRHPRLHGILMDAPAVLETAGHFLAERGVLERVERRPGNMFEEVPRGADAYLLKDILHDWNDAKALAILKSCRRAMEPGKKLLIVEMVVEKNAIDPPGPMVDVHMLVVCVEGRQRGVAEFRQLFEQSGFSLRRVVTNPSPVSVVEAIAV